MSTSPSSSSASELAAFRNFFVVNLVAMGWFLGWVLTGRGGVGDGVMVCCRRVVGVDRGGRQWGEGSTISDDAYENTGVLAWQLRGPLFFHTWTVVDRKSRFRGPCEFTRGPWWTVVFKEI